MTLYSTLSAKSDTLSGSSSIWNTCITFLRWPLQTTKKSGGFRWFVVVKRHSNATKPPEDGKGLRDFYNNCKNSILQQVETKLWNITDPLFRISSIPRPHPRSLVHLTLTLFVQRTLTLLTQIVVFVRSTLWPYPHKLQEYWCNWSSDKGTEFIDEWFSIAKIYQYFLTRSPVTLADIEGWYVCDLLVLLVFIPLFVCST